MACSKCRNKRVYAVPSLLWHDLPSEPMWTVQVRRPVHIGSPMFSRYLAAGDVVQLPFSIIRTLLNAEPPFVHFLNDDDKVRYDEWAS